MATYTVSASNGERIAEVSFLSLPPGTEGSVYLGSGQKAGLVKSSYTGGEGTICNAQGDTVGTVFGSAFDDLCLAVSKNGKTVGGMKAHQVMRGTSPETWTPVATVSTSWTMSDDESVRQFEITMGRGDPGIGLSALAENIRHKERALAGVAALLLSQVGSGIEKMATAAPPASTVPTARVAPVTPSGIAYRSKTSFMSRLMGILFFRPSVYREIAEDTMATGQAAAVVGVVALITGILSGVFGMGNVFGNTALALVVSLVEWVVGSAVIAFIAKSVFQGSNGLGEILRVYGYVHLFGILGILPLLWIVGSILSAIGTIIGIREAADLDTGKAILAGIVASLLIYVLSFALNAALRGLI